MVFFSAKIGKINEMLMVNWKEDQRQKSEENVMLNRCRAAMHCGYITTIKNKHTII